VAAPPQPVTLHFPYTRDTGTVGSACHWQRRRRRCPGKTGVCGSAARAGRRYHSAAGRGVEAPPRQARDVPASPPGTIGTATLARPCIPRDAACIGRAAHATNAAEAPVTARNAGPTLWLQVRAVWTGAGALQRKPAIHIVRTDDVRSRPGLAAIHTPCEGTPCSPDRGGRGPVEPIRKKRLQ